MSVTQPGLQASNDACKQYETDTFFSPKEW